MAIQIGDRFLPESTINNNKLKLDNRNSSVTIVYIDKNKISFIMDKVPGFYTIEGVMPLSEFGVNFREDNSKMNYGNVCRRTSHFTKQYPSYFLNLIPKTT